MSGKCLHLYNWSFYIETNVDKRREVTLDTRKTKFIYLFIYLSVYLFIFSCIWKIHFIILSNVKEKGIYSFVMMQIVIKMMFYVLHHPFRIKHSKPTVEHKDTVSEN